MNHTQYDEFMDRVAEDPHPCKYGHLNCSDRPGGRCCDEEAPEEGDK